MGNFPAILNLNRLFRKLNRFICNQLPVLPNHRFEERLVRFSLSLSSRGILCLGGMDH